MPTKRKLPKDLIRNSEANVLLDFGVRLKSLRVERGVSQSDLALRCKMDRSYISGVECGKRNPTLKVLQRMAFNLDVNLAQLLTLNLPRK